MANQDWATLAAQFAHDHARYGTGAKKWCDAKGINYQSARRYIKVRGKPVSLCAKKESAQPTRAQDQQKTAANVVPITPQPTKDTAPGRCFPANRKGGMYARYFPAEKRYMFDAADVATLDDELMLTRARLQSGIEYLGKIHADMAQATTLEERISLYESFNRCNAGLDTLTARIESLTRTMSSLGIDVVTKDKVIADTTRIINAARKLSLEADNLANVGKGDETPLSDMLDDLQRRGTGGMMGH